MSAWQSGTLLAHLDRTQRLEAFRQGLGGQSQNYNCYLLLLGALAVVGLVVVLLRVLKRGSVRRRVSKADYLAAAARRLGLDGRELRDLRTIASRARLAHPAAMLLSPANLARATRAAFRGDSDPAVAQRVNSLCVRVFGTGFPTDGPTADSPPADPQDALPGAADHST